MNRTRTITIVGLLSATLALPACGDDSSGRSSATTPRSSSTGAAATPTEEAASWGSDAHLATDKTLPVAVGDTIVVVTSVDGSGVDGHGVPAETLQAVGVSPRSGETLWTVDLPAPPNGTYDQSMAVTAPPTLTTARSGGTSVAVVEYPYESEATGLTSGGKGRFVVAVDPSAQSVAWSATDDDGYVVPAADQSSVVLSGKSGTTGLDPATGKQLWHSDYSGAVDITGAAVIISGAGSATALDSTSGVQLWTTGRTDWNYSVLTADHGAVLLQGEAQDRSFNHVFQLELRDAETGAVEAQQPGGDGFTNVHAEIAPSGSAAYVIYPNASMVRVGGAGWTIGLPELEQTGGDHRSQTFVSVTDQQVVIDSNGVVTLDAETGQQVGSVEERGDGLAPLFVLDGYAITVTNGFTVTGTRA